MTLRCLFCSFKLPKQSRQAHSRKSAPQEILQSAQVLESSDVIHFLCKQLGITDKPRLTSLKDTPLCESCYSVYSQLFDLHAQVQSLITRSCDLSLELKDRVIKSRLKRPLIPEELGDEVGSLRLLIFSSYVTDSLQHGVKPEDFVFEQTRTTSIAGPDVNESIHSPDADNLFVNDEHKPISHLVRLDRYSTQRIDRTEEEDTNDNLDSYGRIPASTSTATCEAFSYSDSIKIESGEEVEMAQFPVITGFCGQYDPHQIVPRTDHSHSSTESLAEEGEYEETEMVFPTVGMKMEEVSEFKLVDYISKSRTAGVHSNDHLSLDFRDPGLNCMPSSILSSMSDIANDYLQRAALNNSKVSIIPSLAGYTGLAKIIKKDSYAKKRGSEGWFFCGGILKGKLCNLEIESEKSMRAHSDLHIINVTRFPKETRFGCPLCNKPMKDPETVFRHHRVCQLAQELKAVAELDAAAEAKKRRL